MNQKTFSFPQVVNRSLKKIQFSEDTKSINECLGILLRTRPGELLGDPDYGCNLIERVFSYGGVIIEQLIKEDIVSAVEKYEPRVIMNYEDITIVQNIQKVDIYIQYEIKETGEINDFNLEITNESNPYRQSAV